MRKFLLASTALIAIIVVDPSKAEAAPVGAWVATTLLGAGAAGTFAFAAVAGVTAFVIQVGVSILLNRLMGGQKSQTVRAELSRPSSLPPYRFVYGHTSVPGTVVAMKVIGRDLYGCWLLNSRPSQGPFTIFLDKRRVQVTGDLYDFSGPGATGTNGWFGPGSNGPHCWFWIGDGTQLKCPDQIVSWTGGFFSNSDRFRGATVLWARFRLGSDDDRSARWPSSPPAVEVKGNWSIVNDIRDGVDKFTRNQGLILYDALINNPIAPRDPDSLNLQSFIRAAQVANQNVPVKGGGWIPRYNADGIIVFSDGQELEDQLQPILDAGASKWTIIGGQLSVISATPRTPSATITDVLDEGSIEAVRWKSGGDRYTEGLARFPAPDRLYEATPTPLFTVPGAVVADGGLPRRLQIDLDFVTDYRQAERIVKMMVLQSRLEKSFSATLPPEYFNLVAGSCADLDLPAPYRTFNGRYIVTTAEPGAGISSAEADSEDSSSETISIYMPVSMTEYSDAVYEWDPDVDEVDITQGNPDDGSSKIQPPTTPVQVTGAAAAVASGDTVVAGILSSWGPSTSPSVYAYEWEYQRRSTGPVHPLGNRWQSGGQVATDADSETGIYTAQIKLLEVGADYRTRVRSVGTYGRSDWVTSAWTSVQGISQNVPVPSVSAAALGPLRIEVTATQPNSSIVRTLKIYQNDINEPLTATQLGSNIQAGPSVTVSRIQGGLTSGTQKFYFARSVDQWGNESAFSDSATATTP